MSWAGTVYCIACWCFLPLSLKLHLTAIEPPLPSCNLPQVQDWSREPGSFNGVLHFPLPGDGHSKVFQSY